ncbi:MAG: glucose-6-phosphate isomerase [Gammaproteobacteria bacterium]
MSNPLTSPVWKRLQQLQQQISQKHLTELFEQEPERFQRFSSQCGSLFVDYSKHFIDQNIMDALLELAHHQRLEAAIDHLWRGHILAPSMNAVPYLMLRDRSFLPVCIEGHDVSSEVRNALFTMRRLCEDIRSWNWRGYNGKPLTDIVTLGVGGSGNGAEMVCHALAPYHSPSLKSHFVSNADPQAFKEKLRNLHADTTLFIISSKSFTTQETLQNARLARSWLIANAGDSSAMQQHFIAITSNRDEATTFGIPERNILPVWDWLPGRYSLWTTAGLPIALAIGMERFEQLLDGAHQMDHHFVTTPLASNLPVLLGLLGVWYANFWNLSSRAILPYSELLEGLPGFLQHGLMEATGKSVDLQGKPVDYMTGPIIWGSAGTKNQHTYFQLLHQGTHVVPADFIVVATDTHGSDETTSAFFHFLAQSETLMRGSGDKTSGTTHEQTLPGNKPSTGLLLADLSPRTLGQLLALYEHMALVQSVIWNINPFSHWGTELGKRYSAILHNAADDEIAGAEHDGSTVGLLQAFRSMQGKHAGSAHQQDAPPREESTYSVF